MEEKTEKQVTIIRVKNIEATKEEFLNILKTVSPGTSLRAAIDGIVSAGKGGLIVIENEFLQPILDGGFKLNTRFTSQRLIELAKMDGAIVLSKDMRRILYANVTLVPDSRIPSKETGTRHKAAERTAQMIGTLVIAISERRNEINIYYKDIKYPIRNKTEISRQATETLQLLEKQRELFDLNIEELNYSEINNELDLIQACKTLQKGKTMQKIIELQERTMIGLGNEAIPLKLRIKELLKGIERETDLIIKDYTKLNLNKSKKILSNLTYEKLGDIDHIILALGYEEKRDVNPIKGWRLLSKMGLSEKEIAMLLDKLQNLSSILSAKKEIFEKFFTKERIPYIIKEIEKLENK